MRNKNDRRTLRATLNFVRQLTPRDFESFDMTYGGLSEDQAGIASSRRSKSRGFKYSLGMSGSFKLPRNQFLEASASATISRNDYAYEYQESHNNITTSTVEDYYNMNADVTYGMNFSRGNHLVFKVSEYYNVSSANYYGGNSSWQHLWSSETVAFGEYMHPLWGKASVRIAPGFSAQFYRVHGHSLMKYYGPRLQAVFTYQPARGQFVQLLALYGNSFPQLSFMSGATQQVDVIQVKRGNPDLKQSDITRFMAVYGIGIGKINFQLAGIYNGASHLPVVSYSFENDLLVQSYLPDGNWHQADASLSATWLPCKKFNVQFTGGWLFNGYYGDADIHRSCWKSSLRAACYLGDFALNATVETPTKVVGYDLIETRTPWSYGLSASWSRNALRVEVGTRNLFMHRPTYRHVLDTRQYAFSRIDYDRTDGPSAYIKVNWSVDFGKKTSHDNPAIDRSIPSGVVTPR